MAAILDQQNTTTNGAAILRRSDSADNNYWAQSFVCGVNGTLNSIRVSLDRDGSPTGNLTVKLFADSGTAPTGSALSSSTTSLDVSTISTSQTEYTFDFPDTYSLVSGVKYWLRIEATYTNSNTNTILVWQNNSGDAYTDGNSNRSADGTTWNSDQGTNDLYFKTYITPGGFTPIFINFN